ncbi:MULTISPECIES: sterol desaturase family protein [Azospirillum]|uniref:Sterol desaturase family protein n=2 Tax=Azospirillum brasilense TaxID=192 RepID=A0ABU4NZF5_AZOBR|nr:MULTISPECIES: sterol desaturase family protein [Azospirillum]ALJ37478.1 fatty acid hydroxylase [Azospirillum brasilense]MDW7557775.1 sterol desaturase family protein [Azospirillum brasilense]MDW7597388.1 sterol desaturase family protein [Azospirillum brasilense]MDW7632616.1 sterol desaturase family protein [Azospirillum brasilense]MDX5950818.1 sterol desaturase family protein [Azospirillum brasilense]
MHSEIANSPMSNRQRNYRQQYRERIAGWYNGWLHVAVIYTIGLTAMYIYVTNIEAVRWWEWLTVPAVFLICNFFEWFLHAQIMHRPQSNPGLRAIYTRHTLMHHQFFTEHEMRFADQFDWRVTFFPPYALVVFILMSIPGSLFVGWLISPNVGWLLMVTTTGMYLTYEFMHFCCHVNDNWFVRNCPFVNTIRRHHTAHHNQAIMMERNMNLTFPIADWLFGTSDLNRGLLGHLFNGYDTRHVRTDLRRTSKTPVSGKGKSDDGTVVSAV